MKNFRHIILAVLIIWGSGFTTVSAAEDGISVGMSGEKVGQIQAMLWELNFLNGIVDGDFGKLTEQAVKSYQQKINVTQDGIVNAVLEERLAKESGLNFNTAKAKFFMHASAYSAQDPGLGSRTATGALVAKGVVAVDPRIIPLGSVLYIPGYGKALAADTGGSIKGNVIDIAFDTRSEALQFGRRDNVVVYVM